MVNDYVNNNENVPKIAGILNTVNSNEKEFIEHPLHIPENPHLNEDSVHKMKIVYLMNLSHIHILL